MLKNNSRGRSLSRIPLKQPCEWKIDFHRIKRRREGCRGRSFPAESRLVGYPVESLRCSCGWRSAGGTSASAVNLSGDGERLYEATTSWKCVSTKKRPRMYRVLHPIKIHISRSSNKGNWETHQPAGRNARGRYAYRTSHMRNMSRVDTIAVDTKQGWCLWSSMFIDDNAFSLLSMFKIIYFYILPTRVTRAYF